MNATQPAERPGHCLWEDRMRPANSCTLSSRRGTSGLALGSRKFPGWALGLWGLLVLHDRPYFHRNPNAIKLQNRTSGVKPKHSEFPCWLVTQLVQNTGLWLPVWESLDNKPPCSGPADPHDLHDIAHCLSINFTEVKTGAHTSQP